MKKENQFYNWIKNNSKNIYLERIEGNYTNGIPDLLSVIEGLTAFIELKQSNSNKLENLGLNKYQIKWHIKYAQASGRSFILVLYQKQRALKLFKIGGRGVFSHIITQKKSKSGLQKIWDAIKNY